MVAVQISSVYWLGHAKKAFQLPKVPKIFSHLLFGNKSISLFAVGPAAAQLTGIRISIGATRWYGLSNALNILLGVFDGSLTTGVVQGWGRIMPSYDTYYTLQPGEVMTIESLRFYDGGSNNADAPLTVSVITTTGQRVAIGTYTGGHNY